MNYIIRIIMLLTVLIIALALPVFQEPYKNAEEVKTALMNNKRVQDILSSTGKK
jgi:hypothetical protein